jgi:hypothetical protein
MICRACVDAKQLSTITELGCSKTLLSHSNYYDQHGVFHSHDPNRETRGYGCSNGHVWSTSTVRACNAPGCPYGKTP